MAHKRPTISDVAKAAGVSIGTVSNAINTPDKVRPETRAKIEAAIARLNYRPSAVARFLPAGANTGRPSGHLMLPRLISVGYISVDYVCRVGVLPHRDDRITAQHIEKALGGPAANVAVAAAGLGGALALDVELATAVGEDPDSDWALIELARRGVHALTIRQPFNNRLSRCVVIVEANGSRTIINEPFELSEVDLTAYLDVEPEDRPCCLHIEGYHYERMAGSVARFQDAGWKVSLHTTGLPASSRTPEAFTRLVQAIDLVFVNDVTLREILGMRSTVAALIDQTEAHLRAIGPRADVVLTLGELGAVVFPSDDGPPVFVPALAVEVVDATGAGDTFAGVFLCFWMHGASLGEAARHAAIAASLTTTAEGAQGRISTVDDLRAEIGRMEPEEASA
ncbi:carbohydrate kinase [Skermanella stibiiresistens SB22]|uniref:Carbohydrate kinase n=1 Tax=Skermanella stibiiresistens SB22 TaxID=1385369 RepID=W9H3Q8_9PROT|nr:carbohydrate kinase family protein [Skermanella stibiiresistens]EWY40830.1 carbohydrate kinase [Skermanella stibiiresistens SB22]